MKKRKILHALTYAVLTLGALLVFFPFYLTVVSSLKDVLYRQSTERYESFLTRYCF